MKLILAVLLFFFGFGAYQYYYEISIDRYFIHNDLAVFKNTGIKPLKRSEFKFLKLVSPNNLNNNIRFEDIYINKAILPIQVTFDDAIELCKMMGSGWRLPTTNECRRIFNSNVSIWGISDYKQDNVFFWTSDTLNSNTELISLFCFNEYDYVWKTSKKYFHYFIAVKNIEN
jgi:hypothetical protein